MLHKMKLNESPFERIKDGTKTIEFRLFDEKRQQVKAGDRIEFSKLPDLKEKILVDVLDLYQEKTFKELFNRLGDNEEVAKKNAESMYTIYTPDEEEKYGVLGIKIKINVDNLKDKQDGSSSAKIIGENEDVVRIMTIHKSKGLEFPIVILADTTKKYNLNDVYREKVQMHHKYGIGIVVQVEKSVITIAFPHPTGIIKSIKGHNFLFHNVVFYYHIDQLVLNLPVLANQDYNHYLNNYIAGVDKCIVDIVNLMLA